jgi:uncharacterized membrane protein YphA (DoxX/SURF4 family)
MNAALWTAQVLLALFFLAAGYWHGILPHDQAVKSARWIADLPPAVVRFTNFAEFAGGLGVVLPAAFRIAPRLTPLAAIGLVALMLSATTFHMSRGEPRSVPMLLTVAVIAAFVAWGRLRKVPIPPR